jgi:hypothetical protein
MTQTLLLGDRESTVPGASADGDRLWIALDELERATGWSARPEGLCRGEVCVPARGAAWLDGDRLDFAAFARALGHALARDEERGVWSFGPPVGRGPADVAAPDFRLPDLDGNLHALSDHRGRKVLVLCWASW